MASSARCIPRRVAVAIFLLGSAAVSVLGAQSAATSADTRQTYVLVVEKRGRGETTFSGSYSVNGRQVTVARQRTPFRFACEAGETIAGRFRVDEPGDQIKVRVIDYGYSRRRPAAIAWGYAIQFAWAQPGAGPRFVKLNEGTSQ